MKGKVILIFFLLVFMVFPVFAERVPMPPLVMPTAASSGMGGHHIAYTDNVFSLLVNPAAMIRVQQRSFFTIAPTMFSPVFTRDMFGAISDVASDTSDTAAVGKMLENLGEREGRVAMGFELREFPLSIAWVANGFGFGLWNRTYINFNVKGTFVDAYIFEDLMFPVGMAFRVLDMNGHNLDMGATIKPYARASARINNISVFKMQDDMEAVIDETPIPLVAGVGFDLGLMYRWDMVGLRAGFTLSDVFSTGTVVQNFNPNFEDTNSYYFPFRMGLGLAYDVKLGQQIWKSAPRPLDGLGFTFAFDWHDIGNIFNQDDYLNHRNASLDLAFGFQISMWEIFFVRMGLNEMLPAFGLGFDLGPFKLDFALYGRELGNEPGQLSASMMDISVSIRPGAKQRNWPWARRAIFTGPAYAASDDTADDDSEGSD